MKLNAHCDGCGATLRVPDRAAGKRIRCPRCNAIVSVPVSTVAASEVDPFDSDTDTAAPASRDREQTRASTQVHLRHSNSNRRRQLLRWVQASLLLAFLSVISFQIGRLFTFSVPRVTSNDNDSDADSTADGLTSNQSIPAAYSSGSALKNLLELEPQYSLGEDFQTDSQVDDGTRLSVREVSEAERGEIIDMEFSSSGSSGFRKLTRTKYFVSVEEKRDDRYRGVALLQDKNPPANGSPSTYRILGLIPTANSDRSNLGWVFRYFDFDVTVTTEAGETVSHPDAILCHQTAAAIIAGSATADDVLRALRKMRYPLSRTVFFKKVSQSSKLKDPQRMFCLHLLAAPVIQALLFDADVRVGSISFASNSSIAYQKMAIEGSSPEISDAVVEVIAAEALTMQKMRRALSREILGESEHNTDDRPGSSDVLSEEALEALFRVWENASTDAIVQLLVAQNGTDRSTPLRRLLRERQLTQDQRDSLVTADSSEEESGVLLGLVPIEKIVEIAFRQKESYEISRTLMKLAEHPELSTADADALAASCRRFASDSEFDSRMVLDALKGKASVESLAIGYAQRGNDHELNECISLMRDPAEKKRILDRVVAELKLGSPGCSVLITLAKYGSAADLIAEWQRLPPHGQSRDFLLAISKRPDLTPQEQLRIRELLQQAQK